MHPIALEIGSWQIRSYGVMAAIGFLAASFIINANREKAKMTQDEVTSLVFYTLVTGIIGARAFYVIQFFDYYRDNLWRIIRIDQGGLVFYGGLLAIAAIYVFAKVRKLDFLTLLDITAPALAFAHACGRIGCFLNGCCYGGVTDSCLGVHYPAGSEAAVKYHGAALHPIQLYETAENLVLFALLMYVCKKSKRGITTGCYLAIYGTLRFVNEYFRGDNYRYFGLFTVAQLIGLVLIPTGLAIMLYFHHATQKA